MKQEGRHFDRLSANGVVMCRSLPLGLSLSKARPFFYAVNMQLALSCHPDTPQSALSGITVAISPRRGACLSLSFRARGEVDAICWPGTQARGEGPWTRADELWRHSCFEAIIAPVDDQGYREINLSTWGKWAGYRFSGYRADMARADDVALLAGKWRRLAERAELHALIELPPEYRRSDLMVGLSAVIEAKDGAKSYWALRHPAGSPDFHHADCFAARIAAPEAA